METQDVLTLKTRLSVKAQNAGLFVSRGNEAMHPTRIIDSHELIFVKQGVLDMWEDDQKFHLKAGSVLHLWPHRQHGSSKPLPPDLMFYWIHFEVEDQDNDPTGDEFTPSIAVPQHAYLPHPERLERAFRIFLDEQETGMLTPFSANLLTLLMLNEVKQAAKLAQREDDSPNVVATWANTFIRINFERPITSSDIAEALGYNVDYLARLYRQTFGYTLTQSIHYHRVKKACDYLRDSNLTISQIAPKCGFRDPDYFRRIFKRYMKICPSQYREENSHIHVNTH